MSPCSPIDVPKTKTILSSTECDEINQWARRVIPELLGAHITESLYQDTLMKLPGVDACGEGGEYHTMCLDSFSFRFRIDVSSASCPAVHGSLSYLDFNMNEVRRIEK
jgi:diphthamide synthase (EF-2-diphthine--ammonia ligase)